MDVPTLFSRPLTYSLTAVVIMAALVACVSKTSPTKTPPAETVSLGPTATAISISPTPTPPVFMAGRTLLIRAEQPVMQPVIYYTGTDIEGVIHDWIIIPNDPANMLVMVQVTVMNLFAQDVHVEVNQASAELVATDGSVFRPIDTVEKALRPTAGSDQEFTVPDFIPMWGPATLSAHQQLQGYLVFETPPATEFTELRWLGSDKIVVRFQ